MDTTRAIIAIITTVAILGLIFASFFRQIDPALGPYVYFSLGCVFTLWGKFIVGYYFPTRR